MELDGVEVAKRLLAWWDAGHRALPWRNNPDPYVVWVSEIMLQQTQIATVIPYFEKWMARFPTVDALAAASLDEVLKQWEGLGYYSRARNLHAAAKLLVAEYDSQLPKHVSDLQALPGIGRYTAGAIASIAFNQPAPILDGNVMRVLSRLTDLAEDVSKAKTKRGLWQLAANLVPQQRPGDFNEALMELGQQVCLPGIPDCPICPLAALCLARARGTVAERPVRPPRKRTPHYDVVAGVIWQNGEPAAERPFLITQRPLNGLLGGLWEFPGGKQEKGESLAGALRREIEEELALAIDVGPQLAEVKHAYTHFRITLHAFHARVEGGEPQNLGVADHAWVTLDDLERYAFAVADRQVIKALRRELLE